MRTILRFLILLIAPLVIIHNTAAQITVHSPRLSNSTVTSMAQDAGGYIWFGTAHGLNRYNGSDYTVYYSSGQENGLNNDNIYDLLWDSDGKRLWISNETGLGYYEDGKFSQVNRSAFDPVMQMTELDEDHIVVSGKSGVFKFSKEGASMAGYFYEDGASWVENLIATSQRELWLSYESRDSTFLTVLDSEMEMQRKLYLGKGVSVTGICERPAGTVWVSTAEGMLSFDAGSRSSLPLPQALATGTRGKSILFMLPYKENNILTGLAGDGLYSYNTQSGTMTRVATEQTLQGEEYTCFVDKGDNIWLAEEGRGVTFYADRQPYRSLSVSDGTERISHLTIDRQGFVWMRCGDSLQSVNPSTGEILYRDDTRSCGGLQLDREGNILCLMDGSDVIRYKPDRGILKEIRRWHLDEESFSLYEDLSGRIIVSHVSTLSRLDPFETIDPDHPFSFIMPVSESASTFLVSIREGIVKLNEDGTCTKVGPEELYSVSSMLRASDGQYWFGTYNRGLYRFDEEKGTEEHFDLSSGLLDNTVKSIVEDNDGNIWFSTPTHISRYDIRTGTFATLHDQHFSDGRFYDIISSAKDQDGMLYFGGSGILTVIDPTAELSGDHNIPLRIESITAGGSRLPEDSPSLKLKWRDNSLQIRAAGIDFSSGSLLNYSWMLDGYEKEWQFGSSVIQAVYSYLPAGSYTFKARVREQSGQWSPQEINLPIRIVPAPWASPLAKALYWLLGLGLLTVGGWFIIRLRTQRERLALAEEREELNREHIDFVTNISHEFRTPLAMIYGPARELSKQDLGPKANSLVGTINRNAERLRGLSEQILGSGAGIRTTDMLNVRRNDLVSAVRLMTDNFRFGATEKAQTIELDTPESLVGWFDRETIYKVFCNFLSNAVKYTPEGGHITVSVHSEGDRATVSVADDGPGIPEEMRDRIFGRFDRLGAENGSITGSGIGLNYAMQLAQRHKGTLSFAPNEPSGSVFSFLFPVCKDAYSEENIDETAVQEVSPSGTEAEAAKAEGQAAATVLVVEDTDEIRYFLRDLLSPHFSVVTASDGLEALDSLKIGMPDLVLSDVIMPNLGGIGLCNAIKESPDWGHLPVILLTAKADAESSIEGLKAGADAYIPKPFDPDYLVAAVESQITNRKRIQGLVLNLVSSSEEKPEKMEEAGLNAAEKEFVGRIHALIDENLDNEEFSVQELAKEMAMSYSSLYAKVKGLTGKTPQQFMSTYRMNMAMELLKEGSLSVSEVAYKVGSSSPFTFSREFKKHFGYPPSQVRK